MRKGPSPCKCHAYPFPHREGGGECSKFPSNLQQRAAEAYWLKINAAIAKRGSK